MRHGTCFRRRLAARHAGAAPHSAVAELGVVRLCYACPVNESPSIQYSDLDPILRPWAARHGLGFRTLYAEHEVRMAPVVDDMGDIYQLFAEPTDSPNTIRVGANLFSRAKRHAPSRELRQFAWRSSAPFEQLERTLDDALEQVQAWIAAAGHTRTPV